MIIYQHFYFLEIEKFHVSRWPLVMQLSLVWRHTTLFLALLCAHLF